MSYIKENSSKLIKASVRLQWMSIILGVALRTPNPS